MTLPQEPVTLNVAQIGELSQKLVALRHDVNNQLSLISAATELIRRRPEAAERLAHTLVEQPQKISETLAQFSRDLETTLGITRP